MNNTIEAINISIEEKFDKATLFVNNETTYMKIVLKFPGVRNCLIFNYSEELLKELAESECVKVFMNYDGDIYSIEDSSVNPTVIVMSEVNIEKLRNNDLK